MNREKQRTWHEWLVVNSQLGDRTAINELLTDWYPRLTAYAIRRLGDRDQAKEVVQEAMLGISRGLVHLRDPATFPSWCYTQLERRCIDSIRRDIQERKKVSGLTETGELPADATSEEDLAGELSFERTLSRLDSQQQLLLKLYYQEAFTVSEIAGILEIPAGTVKSRLHHARKALAVALEEYQ